MKQAIGLVFLTIVLCSSTVAATTEEEEATLDDCPSAPSLTSSTFRDAIPKGDLFVMFFAPWCGHCKRMKPTWEELAAGINNDDSRSLTVAKVDCTLETALCSEQGVRGYPTLMYYDDADPGDGDKYSGPRTIEEFEKFIEQQKNPAEDTDDYELEEDDGLYELTEKTFHSHVDEGDHFIKFYAPWCGHCKNMAPAWKQLAAHYEKDPIVSVGNVDCTVHKKICSEFEVKGFPTLIYIRDGRAEEKYQGGRDYDSLQKFVNGKVSGQGGELTDQEQGRVPDAPSVPEEAVLGEVTVLTDETFNGAINEDKLTLVKFYAPWCGHCKRLAPTWDELAKMYSSVSDVVIAKVDCTLEAGVCSVQGVQGYPTLHLFKAGDKIEQYKGDRSQDDLVKFINKHRVKDEL